MCADQDEENKNPALPETRRKSYKDEYFRKYDDTIYYFTDPTRTF